MANPKLHQKVDDGKGIEKPLPSKPDNIPLRKRASWNEVLLPGDYVWIQTYEMNVLMMACPFCGFESPVPHTVPVEKSDPLQLGKEIYCVMCGQGFHVIGGKAIRSWGHLEFVKEC